MGKYDRNLLKICNIIGIWNNSCTLFLHMLFYLFYLSLRFFFSSAANSETREKTNRFDSFTLPCTNKDTNISHIGENVYIFVTPCDAQCLHLRCCIGTTVNSNDIALLFICDRRKENEI